MSEPRLYLYRKAGREVWDAEMWLSDGRRRVWRTGIADRAAAQVAAQRRLQGMLTQALAGDTPTTSAGMGDHSLDLGAKPAIDARALSRPFVPPPAPTAPAPAVALPTARLASATKTSAPVVASGWSDRLDHWFFRDFAPLWR